MHTYFYHFTDQLPDGRREYASILHCYLQRNLAVNGGILDEVRFVVHTKDEEDRRWLEELVQNHGLQDQYILQYESTDDNKWTLWHTFRYIWSTMTDPDTIYVKIDDDIVSRLMPSLSAAVLTPASLTSRTMRYTNLSAQPSSTQRLIR